MMALNNRNQSCLGRPRHLAGTLLRSSPTPPSHAFRAAAFKALPTWPLGQGGQGMLRPGEPGDCFFLSSEPLE